MSRRALVFDGLWYSLCPSFTPLALTRPNPLLKQRRLSSRRCSPPARRIAAPPPHRCYSTNASKSDTRSKFEDTRGYDHSRNSPTPFSKSTLSASEPVENQHDSSNLENTYENEDGEIISPEKGRSSLTWRGRSINEWPRVPNHLVQMNNEQLETLLQTKMAEEPNITGATQIVRSLVRDRGIKPSARHYKALILANSDPMKGSPMFVRSLLEEMEEQGIAADSGTLHAALQALAVHPDFALRQEVLQKLRDRWLSLSPDGWHFVVAGLLREHQFEMVLEQVALMARKDIHVEDWLHSSIIYYLCDMDELDEVLRLMQIRVNQGHDMTPQLWTHVLHTAIEAQHYKTTRFVWWRMAELDYLHLPSHWCSNVLRLAASMSDIDLAKSVLRYLARNTLSPTPQDYEQLIITHVGVGDLPAAFGVLSTMHESGHRIDQTSTKPILAYMIQSKLDRREAWQILKRLRNENQSIPLASVGVIAELCEHDAQNDPSVVDDAVGFYNELHTVCPQGADRPVYNTLIRMCRTAGKRDAGIFLVKEMATLNVIPDAATFETIILMCLDAGNYKSALMYLVDLSKRQETVSAKAKEEIRSICSQSVSEYALRLQYHPSIQDADAPKEEANPGQGTERAQEPESPGRPHREVSREERVAHNKRRRQKKRRQRALERLAAKGIMDPEAAENPELDSDKEVDEVDEVDKTSSDPGPTPSKAGE
ncbi:uncharacterized protein N7482_001771 [Penicillium canariense]|uniref:Pentatricopeptide repeat-containing protein-mitochondrial domain-containing protein n=1 Tax=Penicillium canariense TaxID=189055 RepID=A0A9W9LU80_9EURO|nr:uncharacterized protein N7482_001771 [Penicillium canariense]KAJ5175894.1 hypothetical protein N7482_001771 [Penicillium canariense]